MVTMKRATLIFVIGSDKNLQPIYDKYKNFIPKEFAKEYEYDGGSLYLPLEPDSQELENAINDINKVEKVSLLFSKVYYTKSEEDKVSYFDMVLPDPLYHEGASAEEFGTVYSGVCPVCGLGGKPAGDVLINRTLVRKCKIASLRPDMVVSEEVRKIIEDNGFTGVSFKDNVRDYKGREMKKLYTLEVHNILPPMSDSTWLRNLSPVEYKCGHRELGLASDMQYEADKLKNALDFNLPYEYVGFVRLRHLVVSARVRKAFVQNKIKVIDFEPVLIL